jgi:hypothetical protein
LEKDKNGDLLADSHSILNRWKNYFCQQVNVHRVNNVKQTEIHTSDKQRSSDLGWGFQQKWDQWKVDRKYVSSFYPVGLSF